MYPRLNEMILKSVTNEAPCRLALSDKSYIYPFVWLFLAQKEFCSDFKCELARNTFRFQDFQLYQVVYTLTYHVAFNSLYRNHMILSFTVQ